MRNNLFWKMLHADEPGRHALVQVWLHMLIMGFASEASSWSHICHSDFQVIGLVVSERKRELLAES